MRTLQGLMLLVAAALLAACQPEDRRPGQWLSGEPTAFPEDWSFARDVPEIALEVHTPYFIPHSVTIWCAELDGDLYVAAGRPEEKNWPGWVDDDPRVRLRVGEELIEASLVPLSDEALIRRIQAVQVQKYQLPEPTGPVTARYWRVAPREA
jgi:hypothetical protein